jgi:hypothetical protein
MSKKWARIHIREIVSVTGIFPRTPRLIHFDRKTRIWEPDFIQAKGAISVFIGPQIQPRPSSKSTGPPGRAGAHTRSQDHVNLRTLLMYDVAESVCATYEDLQ